VLTACSEGPTASQDQLTYEDIVNTGLANNCPELPETARGSIPLDSTQSYIFTDLCLQPKEFYVEEETNKRKKEAEFVESKLLTRYTSSLTQISGPLSINDDKSLTFYEEDGIDFQPATVMLPGGEEVPFLFTIKKFVATSQPGIESINTFTDFEGKFFVPSYRSSAFLDPKGRGEATGYDNAVALPAAADNEEIARSNIKRAVGGSGEISLQISKVDGRSGEVAGIFVSEQDSDTDLGAKDAVKVKIVGQFYGRIESAS
jgi:photosystem II oxygen-evolving enhancer protein 1